MNISNIGSASHLADLQKNTRVQTNTPPSDAGLSRVDSAAFSPEGVDALMHSQHSQGGMHMPPLTDDMAVKIGEDIKQQSPTLFAALDTDKSGTLTADKIEAGKDKIVQAMHDGTLRPPQGPQNKQPNDTEKGPQITNEMAGKIGDKIKEKDADLFNKLDEDHDGKLSAKEMESGKETLKSAMKAGGHGGPPPGGMPPGGKPPGGGGGPPPSGASATSATSNSSTTDSTTTEIQNLHQQGLSNADIAKRLGKTEMEVQKVINSKSQ